MGIPRAACSTLAGIIFGVLRCANGAFAELLFDAPNLALTGRVAASQEGVLVRAA